MDKTDCWVSERTRKRKSPEGSSPFSMDDLNQDLIERVLSCLPTTAFFRATSVCKRWKAVSDSASFHLACSQIPSRQPWFFMVAPNLSQPVVFDFSERNWKKLNPPLSSGYTNLIPVAAAGGLICFQNSSGSFIVSNPVTGSCNVLPSPSPASEGHSLHAIAMNSSSKSYKLVLVCGELPKLAFKVYDSGLCRWEEETTLIRKVDNRLESDPNDDIDDTLYFLSKAGNVVATNMQRSPSKQYSSVITSNKEDIVYFLSSSGTIVACNLTHKCFLEYPRLLPVFSEYSIDIVVCGGEMLVVVLSEFLESASLRVWRFDEGTWAWHQITAMPPSMSHEYYGKTVDINCVGAGDNIFICVNSSEIFSYVLCDLVADRWFELPKFCMKGKPVEFMSAFSFEPRIEALV